MRSGQWTHTPNPLRGSPQAVAKGLIGQARADAAKGSIPADPGSQGKGRP